MKSFEINHYSLTPGIYKHSTSGLVVTWDVRIKSPNRGDYLTPAQIHTIEHTLATYLRERYGNTRIVGIFPMGCQTGFYILTRFIDSPMIYKAIVDYIMQLQKIIAVPGATKRQCGQYDLQDLRGAKDSMLAYYDEYLRYQNSAMRYMK